MPGRTSPIQTAADLTSAGTKPYRYGFNGQESDFEIYNSCGTSYDFGARIYDSRLGRWLSVDKKFAEAPNWSPYRYGFDNPIIWIDRGGNYEEDAHYWTVLLIATLLELPDAGDIAHWAERPDHMMESDGSIRIPNPTWADVFNLFGYQTEIHALTGGDPGKERALSRKMMKEAKTMKELGYAVHRLGDSYAHTDETTGKMFETGAGHAAEGHAPDKIKNRPSLYLKYVRDLAKTLSDVKGGNGGTVNMFAFEYIANTGLDTDHNIAVIRTEVLLQKELNTFTIDNNSNIVIQRYLDARKKNNDNFDYTITESNKATATGDKKVTNVNITYKKK